MKHAERAAAVLSHLCVPSVGSGPRDRVPRGAHSISDGGINELMFTRVRCLQGTGYSQDLFTGLDSQ